MSARKRKQGKIVGMRATSVAPPRCSVDASHNVEKNDQGEWFCVECFNEWLGTFVEKRTRDHSIGGIELPVGVKDERRIKPDIKDVYLNRRVRRAARRASR